MATKKSDIMSPTYKAETSDMKKFRITMNGGTTYISTYLYAYSLLEPADNFAYRQKLAVVPRYAMTAVQKIIDSLTAKMADVSRKSACDAYNTVVDGQGRGIDRRGSTMSSFIVKQILRELLCMKRVAIHVDRESLDPKASLMDSAELTPYCNVYACEDIRSWAYGADGELSSVLLRASVPILDPETTLPTGTESVYRVFTKNPTTNLVSFSEYKTVNGVEEEVRAFPTELTKIPVVIFELNQSLLQDIADMQIVLMNYDSWDTVLMKYNFPILTKQKSTSKIMDLFKSANNPGATPFPSNQTGKEDESLKAQAAAAQVSAKEVYGTNGSETVSPEAILTYEPSMERPDFISPSSLPLDVSMRKQDSIVKKIYETLALSYASIRGVYQSDTARTEAQTNGLIAIAFELARGELEIAKIFCMYDNVDPATSSISYPRDFDSRTEKERVDEALNLAKLCDTMPSLSGKKAIMKRIVRNLVVNCVSTAELATILSEIDSCTTIVATYETLKVMVDSQSITPQEVHQFFSGGK